MNEIEGLLSDDVHEEFARFVGDVEPRLSRILGVKYGTEIGREVTADALAYAWEHWDRLADMDNPTGYLYRVAQSRSRWYQRKGALFPEVPTGSLPHVEPALPRAMAGLSPNQRAALLLLHVEQLSEREAAEVMGLSRATVRRHADRAMSKLRTELEIDDVS